MEHFPKIIYKNPGYQNKPPSEPTPEQLSTSEQVAKGKLEKISAPDFKKFSIRFMHIEEYRLMLETGNFGGTGGAEVSLINLGDWEEPVSFLEFIAMASRNPGRYTNWDNNQQSFHAAKNLLEDVHKVEQENKSLDQREKLAKIREEILKHAEDSLHSALLEMDSREEVIKSMGLSTEAQTQLEAWRRRMLNDPKFNIWEGDTIKQQAESLGVPEDLLVSFYEICGVEKDLGEENTRVLMRLRNEPEYIQQPGALRAVINAFTYAVDKRHSNRSEDTWSLKNQYEMMVVFDSEALKTRPLSPGHQWGFIGGESLSEKEKKQALLAAVSILPLKELDQEIMRLEKGAEDFSHPVFSVVDDKKEKKRRAVLRWPK